MRCVQRAGDVRDHCANAIHCRQCVIKGFLKINRLRLQVIDQNEVVIVEVLAQFFFKTFLIQQIGNANGATSDLVFISRTNAFTGGADLGITTRSFARGIECRVIGQDDGTGLGDFQTIGDLNAGGFKFVDFAQKIRHR